LTWDEAWPGVKGEAVIKHHGRLWCWEFIVAGRNILMILELLCTRAADIFGISLDVFGLPKGAKIQTGNELV
jgi:hypothetical protein